MVWVDGPDCVVEAPRDGHKHVADRVIGLVYQVVPSHPAIAPVPIGNDFPDMRGAILKLLLRPEKSLVGRIIRVPVLVLISLHRVQIDDGVDTMPSADVDCAIEMPKSLLANSERLQIAFKVAVVDWEPDEVEPERLEVASVLIHEEVLEKLVEEEVVPVISH